MGMLELEETREWPDEVKIVAVANQARHLVFILDASIRHLPEGTSKAKCEHARMQLLEINKSLAEEGHRMCAWAGIDVDYS